MRWLAEARRRTDPARAHAVVVMTDGADENSRLTLDELSRRFPPQRDAGAGVHHRLRGRRRRPRCSRASPTRRAGALRRARSPPSATCILIWRRSSERAATASMTSPSSRTGWSRFARAEHGHHQHRRRRRRGGGSGGACTRSPCSPLGAVARTPRWSPGISSARAAGRAATSRPRARTSAGGRRRASIRSRSATRRHAGHLANDRHRAHASIDRVVAEAPTRGAPAARRRRSASITELEERAAYLAKRGRGARALPAHDRIPVSLAARLPTTWSTRAEAGHRRGDAARSSEGALKARQPAPRRRCSISGAPSNASTPPCSASPRRSTVCPPASCARRARRRKRVQQPTT